MAHLINTVYPAGAFFHRPPERPKQRHQLHETESGSPFRVYLGNFPYRSLLIAAHST
jgi:hypothetical protein